MIVSYSGYVWVAWDQTESESRARHRQQAEESPSYCRDTKR